MAKSPAEIFRRSCSNSDGISCRVTDGFHFNGRAIINENASQVSAPQIQNLVWRPDRIRKNRVAISGDEANTSEV